MANSLDAMIGIQPPEKQQPQPSAGTAFRPRVVSRCMADVEPCDISWIWPGKIPKGRLTILAGDGGVGKSFASLSIAAILSKGSVWPDLPGSESEPATTVLLNAEDDPADTLRTRLDSCAADCQRVHVVEGIQHSETGEVAFFSLLNDLRALEDKIVETGARLAIVDPIGAYLLGVDAHKDANVRAALGPLAGLASRTGCGILTIMHLNKGQGKAAHRVSGSVGFTNAARMAWIIAADPESERRRVMLPYKFNIVADPSGIAFEITAEGAVRWFPGAVTLDADSVLQNDDSNKAERNQAADWLGELLVFGPMPVTEIKRAAEADCVGWRTVERAKKSLGIRSKRKGFSGGGRFEWHLPTVADNDSIHRQPESGGQCDNRPEMGIFSIDRQSPDGGGQCSDTDRNGTPF